MYVFAFDPLATEMRLMVDASRVLLLPEWGLRLKLSPNELALQLVEHFERAHGPDWTDSLKEAVAALHLSVALAQTTPEQDCEAEALDERLRRAAMGDDYDPLLHGPTWPPN